MISIEDLIILHGDYVAHENALQAAQEAQEDVEDGLEDQYLEFKEWLLDGLPDLLQEVVSLRKKCRDLTARVFRQLQAKVDLERELEKREKQVPDFLVQAMNEGDGVYRP